MQKLVFSKADCRTSFSLSDSNYSFPLQKPMLCPLCGAYQNGMVISSKINEGPKGMKIGTISYKCAHCSEHYLVIYSIDTQNKIAKFSGFYPPISSVYQNETLESISPRFISSYNQALRAELRGDIELAAIGYRQALECLVKDYAIKECKADKGKVAGTSLCHAISEYLEEKNLISTADVVRILGNDYAHYERKYPQHDFELLKCYMDIFIKLTETKLLIAHPPVSRSQ